MARKLGIVTVLLLFGCAKEPLVLHLGSPPTETYTTTSLAKAGYYEVQVRAKCAEDARQVGRFVVYPGSQYFVLAYEEKRGSTALQIDRVSFTPQPAQSGTNADIRAFPAAAIALLVVVALPVAIVIATYNALHPWLDANQIEGCWIWMESAEGFVYQGTAPFNGVLDR